MNMESETRWLMFLCGLLVLFLVVEGRGVLCRVGRRVGDGLEVWRRGCGGDMELAGRGDEGEQKVIRR